MAAFLTYLIVTLLKWLICGIIGLNIIHPLIFSNPNLHWKGGDINEKICRCSLFPLLHSIPLFMLYYKLKRISNMTVFIWIDHVLSLLYDALVIEMLIQIFLLNAIICIRLQTNMGISWNVVITCPFQWLKRSHCHV